MNLATEQLTSVASWLNSTFESFDNVILSLLHNLALSAGDTFTPLFKGISLLAEKGILFIIIAIVFMMFRKTRKLGICMFGAIACGAIITNFVLKDLIVRPRPFIANETYKLWWEAAGAVLEDGFSFPSGHATATMAAMTAVFLCCNKKYSWIGFIFVILMGISRNYLMVHYITKLIYYILSKNPNNKFCKFVLEFSLSKDK